MIRVGIHHAMPDDEDVLPNVRGIVEHADRSGLPNDGQRGGHPSQMSLREGAQMSDDGIGRGFDREENGRAQD